MQIYSFTAIFDHRLYIYTKGARQII